MEFKELPLKGAWIIEPEKIHDTRGFFARAFCEQQFMERDLEIRFPQSNISYNFQSKTLRGMHWQNSPHQEVKLVRCTYGAIYDVIVDLRKDSDTYCQWVGVELSDWNRKMIYVPEDFAHGYLTLVPDCEVHYQVSEVYNKQAERGARFDDPAFNIKWKDTPKIVSERDLAHSPFEK